MGSYNRPNWDEYLMEVCEAVSRRATCDRGRSGAVLAKDGRILATGYVGSLVGQPHCDDVGHQLKTITHEDGHQTEHCMRTVHAEQNAICQAARLGIAIEGATLYCRMTPCRTCTMLLINCGITRVVAQWRYQDGAESEQMLQMAKIQLKYFNDKILEYK